MTYMWSMFAGIATGAVCTIVICSALWRDPVRLAERERRWRTQGRHRLRL
ncbi:MAG TPA: hypothetical protein VIR27_07280 [Mycobacteriales bacterium]